MMRHSLFILLIASLPLLAACRGPLPKLGDTLHNVDREETAVATIKGFTAPRGFLSAPKWTEIDAIDGKYAFYLSDIRNGIPLEPGPHAVLISYGSGSARFPVVFRLEAKSNRAYVVKWREIDDGPLGLEGSTLVFVENSKTGEKVTREIRIYDNKPDERYVEPSGPPETLATISGSSERSLFETNGAAFLQSVDGFIVNQSAGFLGLTKDYDYNASYKLEPGLHALGIGFKAAGFHDWVLPVMFEVRPGARYALKFEKESKLADTGQKWRVITVWMVDEARDDEIVLPQTSMPLSPNPF